MLAPLLFLSAAVGSAAETEVGWEKLKLDTEFFGEGACFGDVDGDGANDIISGPWVYFGPKWSAEEKAAIYEPKPFNKVGYSDNFFSFARDIDGDGDVDVLVLGFPGKDASWFENPGVERKWELHWARHQVLDIVDNESPDFTDLTGDGKPEIVCSQNGVLGYAEINATDPKQAWKFTAISPEKSTGAKFTHGLGVGDVNGDGRADILEKQAWWEQPASLERDPMWQRHLFAFSGPGGADMLVDDFDGDGDNDVVTSLAAHGYGLAWYEQVVRDGKKTLEQHLIIGETPQQNPYGVSFSQLHALFLADVDGDGIKDVVTGKRHWAHNGHDPDGNGAAVIYWFRTHRLEGGGVEFVPHQIDNDSGVGTDVQVGDVNGDDLPDVVVGNKKGTFVHLQTRDKAKVTAAAPVLKRPIRKPFVETGLTAEEAVKQMTLTEGFSIRTIAAEPDVKQPIAMAIDERGRIWIAEAYSYPVRQPEGEGKDRILILSDDDGDGEFETRKVFIEGLNLVSGIEIGFGGVWVGAAPHFLFIPDKDHDDVPDREPEILLDGWGYQDTHETLNSFVWGPDGWLYGCHGVFTHSKVGKPGTPDAERIPLNAGVWRYHPTRHEFDVFSHGTSNPWGLDFDENGEAFVTACVIPHFFHMIPGGRYHRQGGQHFNPHTYADIQTIADHAHFAGNIRDHAHWGDKASGDFAMPSSTLELGGGHAHCGLTIYRGDQFPAEFRGRFLFTNLHGHGIVSDYTIPEGSGFVGKHGPDFLYTNDRWSMPIDIQYGPDGGLFVIDWYDQQNCHRRDEEIWDRSNGRLYKVDYGTPKPKTVNLAALSDEELVKLHDHANDWWVHTARRLLQERSALGELSEGAKASLVDVLQNAEGTDRKLGALWTLFSCGAMDKAALVTQLGNEDARVRGWAVRLLAEDGVIDAAAEKFIEMARSETSPVVRRELASLLQRTSSGERWEIAMGLLSHAEDVIDHNLPLLIWYGMEPLVMEDPARALELATSSKIPLVRQFIYRRLAHEETGRDSLFTRVSALKGKAEAQTEILTEIATVLGDRASAPMPKTWDLAFESLSDGGPEVQRTLELLATKFGDQRMLPRFRKILADPKADPAARDNALSSLISAKDAESVPILLQLVQAEASPIRAKAIRALANFTEPKTAGILLSTLDKLNAAERTDAINVLASNVGYARALLDALGDGRLPRSAISAFTARQIRSLDEESLNAALEKNWGKVTESSEAKKAELARYRTLLTPEFLAKADLGNGRALFTQTCFACHTLFGEGNAIGPDITGGNRQNLEFLLENILDPSSVVGDDYRLVIFTMKDGRVVSGMVRSENDNAVRVAMVGADEQLLAKTDIAKREPVPVSMMPEGILAPLADDQVRDLIAYLQSPIQVRMAIPGERLFEGEELKIVSDKGNPRPQRMGNFKGSSWSGGGHLWWTEAKPGDELVIEFSAPEAGTYSFAAALTKAPDYGIFSVTLDGKTVLAEKVDLFNQDNVVSTGELNWGDHELAAGPHTLNVKVIGSNPAAVHRHMFGLDYLRLMKH